MSIRALRLRLGVLGFGILVGGYNRGSGFVIHHTGMRQNLETRFGRFHLQVAQHQLVFLLIQLCQPLRRRKLLNLHDIRWLPERFVTLNGR